MRDPSSGSVSHTKFLFQIPVKCINNTRFWFIHGAWPFRSLFHHLHAPNEVRTMQPNNQAGQHTLLKLFTAET